MAQSITAIAKLFGMDAETLVAFRETLSAEDQQILDQLFGSKEVYQMAFVMQGNTAAPMELLLLIMLIEHHKALRFLVDQLNEEQKFYLQRARQLHGKLKKQAIQ